MGISQRLILPALVLLANGCAVTNSFTGFATPHKVIAPAQVVGAWNNKLMYVPDPANNGMPSPGLAGRVYLFGPTPDFPIAGDGSIVVDLYDDTPRNGQPSSVHLEQWRFDPESLRRLFKKDMIGMGYTVFLPWGTYRPDIQSVHLALKYEPAQGMPIYSPSGPMAIEHVPSPTGAQVMTQSAGPALGQPTAPMPPNPAPATLPMPRRVN